MTLVILIIMLEQTLLFQCSHLQKVAMSNLEVVNSEVVQAGVMLVMIVQAGIPGEAQTAAALAAQVVEAAVEAIKYPLI